MIIYKITNTINNKIYIGQTTKTLNERILYHLYDCKTEKLPLYNAINKYGWNNFKVEVIDNANTQEELNKKEIHWIKELNSLCPNGYNLTTGGSYGKHLEETKQKLRHNQLGSKSSWYGKKHSEETKNKQRLVNIGSKNPNFGKHRKMTEETKNILRLINLGFKNPMFKKKQNLLI